jgi:hypothetical protein
MPFIDPRPERLGQPIGSKIALVAAPGPPAESKLRRETPPMKANHIIFVPGLFGWGPGEIGGFPYSGDAMNQFAGFKTHWVKCGPISSFHDRACEVFAKSRVQKSITAPTTARPQAMHKPRAISRVRVLFTIGLKAIP